MEFKDEYVLEGPFDFPQYDVILRIESDPHDQLFVGVGYRGDIEIGNATIGFIDNDAIDGIIALLERARIAYNS